MDGGIKNSKPDSQILNPKDLPQDRLTTSDKEGRRVYVYPSDVTGRFKKYRNVVQVFLILIFLVLPWINIGGYQSVLLDIPNRRFAIFGLTFWAHDAPMLVFVFGGAALSIAFITAVWGRAWCGWACPQTVFIENVFRRIERFVEGDAVARKALDAGGWSGDKVWKKALKWSLFLGVTLVISHSFLAYFVGAQNLGQIIRRTPGENFGSFLFMAAFSGLLLFDFGWFREQFCTVVCPYGRFQSLLMDNHSLVISYDEKRGEPRKQTHISQEKTGDCVNCYRCVQVCPTGIDIRRGVQLECIACTACIDACDDVMERLKKPRGLIRYATEVAMHGQKTSFIRPRTIVYFLLVLAVAIGLIATVRGRSDVELLLVRPNDVPYQDLGHIDGKRKIANRFKVELSNQTFEPIRVKLAVEGSKAHAIEIIGAMSQLELSPGQKMTTEVFIKFDRELLSQGKAVIGVVVTRSDHSDSQVMTKEEVTLVGPYL
ncbi:MAG: cytochrome c oxidase accessory protein CcoG [Bdellovibrionota bacterium]